MASPDGCPALVLNADFRPLSYYPLSLWSWQDAIKAVFMDRVNIVSEYDTIVRSPSFDMRLPSVVSLKSYIKPSRTPAFTRFNVFLRDPCARATRCRPRSRCSRPRSPMRRRSTISIATESSSRRITCTKAGSTISTGIRSWSRKA
jgi:5-methylcytosine-specific restriction endonuclease McrA